MKVSNAAKRVIATALAIPALTVTSVALAGPADASEVTSGGPTMTSCPHAGWCTHNSGWFHSPSSGTHAHCRDRGHNLNSEGAVLKWKCDGNHLYYVPVEDD